MEFRLLGPVEVWSDGHPVRLGGAKPRALLTALLLGNGRVVPTDRLVEAIWGVDPPPSARAVLHTYVATLRRSFEGAGLSAVIVSHRVGYRTEILPDALDSAVFERLVARGRRDVGAGKYREAAETFRAALGLWRGAALGCIGDSFLRAEADRLNELRLTVTEERISAELVAGRAEELLGELRELVALHPAHERLRRDLMVALYRCGRQADALAVFRAGRDVLRAELGIEPGPELRQTHEAILRADPALLPVQTAEPVVPHQLPAAPVDFTGREGEVSQLRARLTAQQGVPVCVLSGPGGIGKSALATHVAHSIAESFPDGQLHVELRGTTDSPATPEEVLGRLLRELGGSAELPAPLDERVSRYRTALSGRRMLVVLDDAATERQVRLLLPGTGGCAVLITSRNRLAGLAGAMIVDINVLPSHAAVELLSRVAGNDRISPNPVAAQRIARQCGYLPLAIRIAGARLAARRHWTVELLADRLTDERRRLDELAAGDQEVRASISLSYAVLPLPARKALRRLGLLGLPSFPCWVVATVMAVGRQVAERLLEQLEDASLVDIDGVDPAGQVRYRLHDLIRLFARERAEAEETAYERTTVVTAVLSRWLRLVERIAENAPSGVITTRAGYRLTSAVDPAVERLAVANPHAWFTAEEESLVVGVELASAMALDEIAVELASALCHSIFVTDNLFDAWRRTHDAALAAARRAGNAPGEAALLAELGQLRLEQDRYAEAREYLSQALSMFRAARDCRGEGATLAELGAACREQGYLPEALHFLGKAEQLWVELADPVALGHVKRLAGSVYLEQGDYPAAWSELTTALSTYRAAGSRRGEGLTLRTMSLYHRARGELDHAEDLAGQALAIFREIGDQLLEAYGMRALAKVHIRLGRLGEARRPLEDALVTSRDFKDRWGEACTMRIMGELHAALGRLQQARSCLEESLRQWEALDISLFRARTLRDLAAVHDKLGDGPAADAARTEALEIFRTYGAREYRELSPA